MNQRIAVIGSGYVGSVAAACLAHVGHDVVGVESDALKLERLQSGVAPFHEPGLDALLESTLASGHLTFTADFGAAMAASEIVFVCVGTPPGADGLPDMTAMAEVARSIAENLRHHHVIVTKSTVPIGTGRWLTAQIQEYLGPESDLRLAFSVVSNPEFLREGRAVEDYLHPDRVVLGSDDARALELVAEVYEPILEQRIPGEFGTRARVPLLQSDLATGEMTKYASNAFLATKVSFANEIARLCDFVGADISAVTEGMGLDSRIGRRFLEAGLGWGGSCLGKDLSALVSTAVEFGYHPRLLEAAMSVNDGQRQFVVDELLRQLRALRGARVCILGLAFKAGTDDIRDSPGLDVAERLVGRGAFVTAYDPMVRSLSQASGVRICEDAYEAARGVDAIVVATEWPEFSALDLLALRAQMQGDLLFDARNIFDPASVRSAGYRYLAIGRPAVGVERLAPVVLMPAPARSGAESEVTGSYATFDEDGRREDGGI
ncbi:MAG: UDP-glucose dehydrogenase [Acidimicrobiaceae bacterium]|nr:UDP-glucose dehydrogenase [Acidimicrobiaceae bacterium]